MCFSEDPCTSCVALQKRIFGRRSKPLNATLSTQEFNSFHTIDHKLFTRLVFSLGRDPAQSAEVMALWMWLEHNGNEFNLVYKALMTLRDTLLNALADESVFALYCIQSNVVSLSSFDTQIPMLQAMSNSSVTLRFFHENRGEIASAVVALLNNVCLRVFEDLLVQPRNEKMGCGGESSCASVNGLRNPVMGEIARGNVQGKGDVPLYWHPQMSSANLYYLRGGFDHHELAVQRQNLNSEMEEVLSCLNLNDGEAQEVVPPHERSIFLTFSKGYPIRESEVRNFFTRKFGEIIDEICMQEDKESPLYARLVLRSASSIPVVLGGKMMVQFCVDGKDVRARKYVPKHAHAGSPVKIQTTPRYLIAVMELKEDEHGVSTDEANYGSTWVSLRRIASKKSATAWTVPLKWYC